jgi:hypothetical protein
MFLADRKPRTYAAYGHDLDEFASFRDRSREKAVADLLIGSRSAAADVSLATALADDDLVIRGPNACSPTTSNSSGTG